MAERQPGGRSGRSIAAILGVYRLSTPFQVQHALEPPQPSLRGLLTRTATWSFTRTSAVARGLPCRPVCRVGVARAPPHRRPHRARVPTSRTGTHPRKALGSSTITTTAHPHTPAQSLPVTPSTYNRGRCFPGRGE